MNTTLTRSFGRPPGSDDVLRVRTTAGQVPKLLLLAWGALFFNVLTPFAASTVVPIPHVISQAMAQGSLGVALVLALLVNPRIVIRPNFFLALMSLMAVTALAVSIHNEFFLGSTYRAVRLVGFVICLWLLTPWWGRQDLVLLRAHRLALWGALASAAVGAMLSPGKAFAFEGRLAGVLWPMPPTVVAHYAAILFGTSAVMWMCRVIGGQHALVAVLFSSVILVATHTRTAIAGAIAGLVLATVSLFMGNARVRRTSVAALVGAVAAAGLFASEIVHWAARGQSAEQASDLTGRANVWSAVAETSRPRMNELFGAGLSNKSFDGLSVDSSWVATYLDLGWFAIVIQILFLLALVAMAVTHVRGPRRAIALFLITYCVVASITETGLGDASPYLLDLVVAAALVAPPLMRGAR